MTPLLCFVVFLSAMMIDFAHARCVVAIAERDSHRAALWSLVQWVGATVGFIIAVKVTFWVLPFEAAGLYVGTVLAIRPAAAGETSASMTTSLAEPLRSGRIPIEAVRARVQELSSTYS